MRSIDRTIVRLTQIDNLFDPKSQMHNISANQRNEIHARTVAGNTEKVDGEDEESLKCLNARILNTMEKNLGFARVVIALSRIVSETGVVRKAERCSNYSIHEDAVWFSKLAATKEGVKGGFAIQDWRPRVDMLEKEVDQAIDNVIGGQIRIGRRVV